MIRRDDSDVVASVINYAVALSSSWSKPIIKIPKRAIQESEGPEDYCLSKCGNS